MKRHLGSKFFLFVFLTGLLIVSIPSYSAAQKVITLNYANFFPATNPHSIIIEQWGKDIEKKTNGRVKITFFHGGTLAPAAQIYDSTVKGISDIGLSCFSYTRGKFPLTEVIDLPLGIDSGVVATNLVNEYYKKFKPKELDETKVLYLHAHGPGLIHTTKKPVYKLEELKGMKIRATGLASKIAGALGAAPVGTTMPETYDALRTGVAEGAMAPFMALEGFRWGEVVKYSILNYSSSYSTGFFVVMNKSKWNAMPADIQKIFADVNSEYIEKTGRLWVSTDEDGIKFIQKLGVKMLPQSKEEAARWAKAVKPLQEDYVNTMKSKGLPGSEALKFALDFIKKNQK
ncbi:MAG: C4-dicarboxylate ABC transporter substrate-binding protein [Syntrophus sp. (in: bacteria)]|nr:C4-dicarboxylate ABC transporter substrate-binding protein [Syntrophus sp. (in: bacteria)]